VSLEARVPLLDLELMRFVERVPPQLKIRGRTRKYILRQAVAKWVPEDVLRRKKIAFQSPIDSWLRTDLTARVKELLLAGDSACMQYFRRDTVTRMIAEHVKGREDYKRALLSLIVFELWHEKYVRPSRDRLLGEILCGDLDGQVERA
jgi:asparagine synthase (glutamine-hydrolysing)